MNPSSAQETFYLAWGQLRGEVRNSLQASSLFPHIPQKYRDAAYAALAARYAGEADDRRAKLRAMFRNTSPEARALLGFTPRATIEEMRI